MQWTVVVAMRALPSAKSRLRDVTDSDAAHARLVDAIRHDTLRAVAGTPAVARIVLAVDEPWTATDVEHEVFVQTSGGLNEALSQAQAWAMTRWPQEGIAALVGDLPALRPSELDLALAQAAGHERAYVADAARFGTTTLTARPGIELRPAFGDGSAARHDVIASAITAAGPGLRLDVDTPEDLAAALRLGVGTRTTEVAQHLVR